MSLDQHTPPQAPAAPAPDPAGPSATERRIALTESLAPIAVGVLAPWLDGGATAVLTGAYAAAAAFTTTNYARRIPGHVLNRLPAGDVAAAHRQTLFTSTLTTGVALGVGSVMGPHGIDALMAGVAEMPANPIAGIVSLGWWGAVALVPFKLRRIFKTPKKRPAPAAVVPGPAAPTVPLAPHTGAKEIAHRWATYVSHPTNGSHRGQELLNLRLDATQWTATILAPTGAAVTVTREVVSSVFQKPVDHVHLTDGAHAGEKHLAVHLHAPAELNADTLAGAWTKWAARRGGVMAGTHLEDVQPDPHTGGEVARVVADDDTDALPTPDMRALVGALRTSQLLLSYEPTSNPRRAIVRLMETNPLEAGVPFPGTDALLPSNGYFRIGTAVSGRPVRAQLLDPKLGARHLLISGVTGSGKGGALQLIALAAHLAGAVIIYADPKGSSNPAIEEMAAYSGLGEDGAMGALLLMEAIHAHRIDYTAEHKLKNFDRTRMPHVVFIMDEASALLGEKAKYRKDASRIVAKLTKEGRSLGESVVLATQLIQLAELGGDSAIRDNIVMSGGCIMLRSDSSQRHLVDLPPGMESVNPADIPATWNGDDGDTLIYDDATALADPEATFGLGYFMTTDGICAMGRTYTLEDASDLTDPNKVTEPHDYPDWDERHTIVAQALEALNSDGQPGRGGEDGFIFDISSMPKAPAKPASADAKILAVLEEAADPLGIDTIYLHKDQIGSLAGLEGSTLDNALTRLAKKEKIHRQVGENGKEVRGMYGLGPGPSNDDEDAPDLEEE